MAQQSPLFNMMMRTHYDGKQNAGWIQFQSYHHQSLIRNRSCHLKLARIKSKARSVMLVGCKSNGDDEKLGGDKGALETVLKLYSAIKNKSSIQLSDVIGDECVCISNFDSTTFQPFHGKQQVLAFFSSVMKNLGNNVEFIVQPTFEDGMNVGISWRLEWRKNHVPLGRGFSFYTCHIYQGKMLIRNVDMFLEPILHLEQFRLKTVMFLMNAVDEIMSKKVAKKIIYMLPLLLLASIFLVFVIP